MDNDNGEATDRSLTKPNLYIYTNKVLNESSCGMSPECIALAYGHGLSEVI